MFQFPVDPSPEQSASFDRVEEELRRSGMHVETSMMLSDSPDGDGETIVVLDCLLGDLAFRKRVQDPEQHEVDRTTRDLDERFTSQRFADVRDELMRRAENDERPLGDDLP